MYCQSTVLSCVRMLFVLSKYCLDALEGYINRRCVSNMLFQSTKFWGSLLQSYQHSEGVSRYVLSEYQHWLRESHRLFFVLSEYLPWVSPNMLVKAPNSGGVSCQSTNTLRESPGMYCQSTNTAEGVTPIVVARCLQICLLKHRILGESPAKVPTL